MFRVLLRRWNNFSVFCIHKGFLSHRKALSPILPFQLRRLHIFHYINVGLINDILSIIGFIQQGIPRGCMFFLQHFLFQCLIFVKTKLFHHFSISESMKISLITMADEDGSEKSESAEENGNGSRNPTHVCRGRMTSHWPSTSCYTLSGYSMDVSASVCAISQLCKSRRLLSGTTTSQWKTTA